MLALYFVRSFKSVRQYVCSASLHCIGNMYLPVYAWHHSCNAAAMQLLVLCHSIVAASELTAIRVGTAPHQHVLPMSCRLSWLH